jgi:hypothetical protein
MKERDFIEDPERDGHWWEFKTWSYKSFNAFIINLLNFFLMPSLFFELNGSHPLEVVVSTVTFSHVYRGAQLRGIRQ